MCVRARGLTLGPRVESLGFRVLSLGLRVVGLSGFVVWHGCAADLVAGLHLQRILEHDLGFFVAMRWLTWCDMVWCVCDLILRLVIDVVWCGVIWCDMVFCDLILIFDSNTALSVK